MGRVTDGLQEKRIVSVCLRCSDSEVEEGKKIAVTLNGRSEMVEIPDFDWSEWAAGTADGGKKARAVTLDQLREVFEEGNKWLKRAEAVKEIAQLTGASRTVAYDALKQDGIYGKWIREHPANKTISILKEQMPNLSS